MWVDEKEKESNHYCILYEAPHYKSLDYFGFLLLNSLIGESDGNASFISSLGMSNFSLKSVINFIRKRIKCLWTPGCLDAK
jgi:predicted Zn-dependent peptidase